MQRHPSVHVIWACVTLAGVLGLIWLSNPAAWPPPSVERRTQRRQVLERVESAGGWTALKRDCNMLANAYKDDPYGFRWFRFNTDPLPPAIAALRPREVEFYSPKFLEHFGSEGIKWHGSNVVVRISVFGAHATGGHSQPSLGLDVVCEPGVPNYSPARLRSEVPFRYWRYRKVADDVYEFF